jgi:hypothetical protein
VHVAAIRSPVASGGLGCLRKLSYLFESLCGWEEMKMRNLAILLILGLALAGCAGMTKTEKSALGGAALGALGGQLIGGDTKSTLAGTVIGAGAGGLAGHYSEAQDRKQQQAYQQGYTQGYYSGQEPAPIAYNQAQPQAQPQAYPAPIGGSQIPQSDPAW